jgi:ABC-type Fe3+-citrate transport system substrate-binding protein
MAFCHLFLQMEVSMKKVLMLLLLLLLAACGSSETAVNETVGVVQETAGETAVSEEIVPVSAKPQLIEFYADW